MGTKAMKLRRNDSCLCCSVPIPAGTPALWDATDKEVTCLACIGALTAHDAVVDPATTAPPAGLASMPVDSRAIDVGDPGRSAREEHARRQSKQKANIEQKWGTGRIGKVAKFLSDEPQTTKAWAQGATGEERIAQGDPPEVGDQFTTSTCATAPDDPCLSLRGAPPSTGTNGAPGSIVVRRADVVIAVVAFDQIHMIRQT